MESAELSSLLEQQGIIAADPQMWALYRKASYLAKTDATILICGESGVGKDRIAKFIHSIGPRRGAPFIHINCSAVPQELFESELFGYESGTFTGGLTSGKRGLLEAAQGGTLYLDEIGEMSLLNQVKLLDFLQNKQITRLGSSERKSLNVRIISATNRDLKQSMKAGAFREDLYYRICVVTLKIPPLRERKQDIAALAQAYVSKAYPDRELSRDAISFLQGCDWPGNLRELQNFLERVCILTKDEPLSRELLERYYKAAPKLNPQKTPAEQPRQTPVLTLKMAVAQFEKNYISQAILQTSTLNEAAARLGIDLDTLNRKKRQFGIYKRWHR